MTRRGKKRKDDVRFGKSTQSTLIGHEKIVYDTSVWVLTKKSSVVNVTQEGLLNYQTPVLDALSKI
jgi:hypothetical protein